MYMNNKLSNITPCKSNAYILFSTNSDERTRTWTRTESSGRLFCCDGSNCLKSNIIQARLKYKVLQHQSSNNGPGVDTTTEKNQLGRICDKTSKSTVRIRNILYRIDTRIANVLNQMITNGKLLQSITLVELQNVIAQIRKNLNLPSTDQAVLYKNVPLSQYKPRYTYFTGVDKRSDVNKIPVDFDIPYKTGIIFPQLPSNYSGAIQQIINKIYSAYFPTFNLSLKNSQFIYVVRNDTCSFTGILDELFPAQNKEEEITSASLWGTNILTSNSINLFLRENIKTFEPVLTSILPGSSKMQGGKYDSKFGILFNLKTFVANFTEPLKQYFITLHPSYSSLQINLLVSNVVNVITTLYQQNSQMLFIPLQTQIDLIESVNYPPNLGVTFPLSNDGLFNQQQISIFQQKYKNINKNY